MSHIGHLISSHVSILTIILALFLALSLSSPCGCRPPGTDPNQCQVVRLQLQLYALTHRTPTPTQELSLSRTDTNPPKARSDQHQQPKRESGKDSQHEPAQRRQVSHRANSNTSSSIIDSAISLQLTR